MLAAQLVLCRVEHSGEPGSPDQWHDGAGTGQVLGCPAGTASAQFGVEQSQPQVARAVLTAERGLGNDLQAAFKERPTTLELAQLSAGPAADVGIPMTAGYRVDQRAEHDRQPGEEGGQAMPHGSGGPLRDQRETGEVGPGRAAGLATARMRRREVLGGLIHEYERAA
ncbi:MAG: hypothetical protein ACRDPO_32355 [Streptosporangiaceae bacterium]